MKKVKPITKIKVWQIRNMPIETIQKIRLIAIEKDLTIAEVITLKFK